ncbi:HEPN domain-containing protein [Sinomicrobium pectinilyticum]|uniref:HEPN domain-containing protein n=1 Tax=Sinomicrobium pectinilyticum TaxID=1084421 RepID=A0A3N0E604_SINP1|nr:HEPN domain-containing protein [Sinomicrobium pectinilyticum]RNL83265.1 HEPN domain-containing protein [Sinomicrobium pectinilyticum]
MNPKTQIYQSGIIDKLTKLLEVQYIYEFPITTTGKQKNCVLIIKNHPDKSNDNLSSVADIFKDYPEYLYRAYPENYTREQLIRGNIFFIQACLPQYLQYHAPDVEHQGLLSDIDLEQLLDGAETYFQEEFSKTIGFKQGAQFYQKKENYPQAVFMLHQAFELAYRTVELFTMGKEKVCHSIANHQQYILPFVPELGQIFSLENDSETKLVKLLDIAYRNVRYGRDYHITPEDIAILQAKLEKVLSIVEQKFYSGLTNSKEAVETKIKDSSQRTQDTVVQQIERLISGKYRMPFPKSNKVYYQEEFHISSPSDMLHTASSMLKVCIMAAEYAESNFSPVVPQPHYNIQRTLEIAVQLLPYDEMECLEEIIEACGGLEQLLKTHLKPTS